MFGFHKKGHHVTYSDEILPLGLNLGYKAKEFIESLKDPNKKPIALYSDKLELSVNTNEKTNKDNTAKIEVSKNDVKIMGQTIADAFSSNTISVEGYVATETVVANQTVNNKVNTISIKTEAITLFDDDDPTIVPTSFGVAVNNGVVTPTVVSSKVSSNEVEGKKLTVENITLGEEDLDTRLKRLEDRINILEGNN